MRALLQLLVDAHVGAPLPPPRPRCERGCCAGRTIPKLLP